MGIVGSEMNRYKEIIIVCLVSLAKGEELPCLEEGSGVGVSIEKGRQSSSWEDCQRMCDELTNCSAWTFHEISPFSCDFFSKLESINAKNFSVTGKMNCQDQSSIMVKNEGINERNFINEENNCIMKGVKIMGDKLGRKLSKDSFEECRIACQKNDLCNGWSFKKKEKKNRKLFSELFLNRESKKQRQQFVSGTKNCSDAQTNSTIQGSGRSSRALTITSTNFPQNYRNYENKAWNVWTGTGRVLGFSFSTFELEEGYDWVKVTDQGSGRVLFYNYPRGAASGKLKTFTSDSNRVYIQFKTDYSVTRKGFSLQIWGRPKNCFKSGDYWGADLPGGRRYGVTSPDICQKLCQETTGCEYFSWHNKESKDYSHNCFLKSGPGFKGLLPWSVVTSGPRDCDCTCGLPNRATRIVGGQETEVNEYPWQVRVLKTVGSTTYVCGGS